MKPATGEDVNRASDRVRDLILNLAARFEFMESYRPLEALAAEAANEVVVRGHAAMVAERERRPHTEETAHPRGIARAPRRSSRIEDGEPVLDVRFGQEGDER
jgi:hypothetical protein